MTSPSSPAAGDPVEETRLAQYLETVPHLRHLLPLTGVERIGRGQSNLTYRLTLRQGTAILRRPPIGPLPPSAHDVLREVRVIRALGEGPVPVPRVLAACADDTVLGAPFYLMEDLPGDAIRFSLPPALEVEGPRARRAIGEAVIEALANLHSLEPTTVGLGDLGRPTGYLARQLRRWNGQLDYARTRPVPDLDWVGSWLERNLPPDVDRPSIVHGDYKLDNVIFSLEPTPRLLAVVDWEMATLGDPLADLGWLLAFWCEGGTPPPEIPFLPRVTEIEGFPTRSELAHLYARKRRIQLPDLRFYVVFALWKMAVLLEGHWARHVRGTAGTFDFRYLEAGGPILAAYIRDVAAQPAGSDDC